MTELTEGHTVRRYDAEVTGLRLQLLEMGDLVLAQIARGVTALVEAEGSLARQVISADRIVDEYAERLDEETVGLLALRQPMGGDLRVVIGIARAVSDLERIGDEAAKIARIGLALQRTTVR